MPSIEVSTKREVAEPNNHQQIIRCVWVRVWAYEQRMARAGGITNAVNVGIAVQADWENREFISHISLNVRRLFEFLVQFGTLSFSCFFSAMTKSN